MKKTKLGIALGVLALAGCAGVARIPDEKNPALFSGEAAYLASRCPQLEQHRFLDTIFAYCLSNKIYAGGCEKRMAGEFWSDQERGKVRASEEFANMNDPQVCRVANERYGAKGSRFVGLLLPRKK
jgi:hypothetical protein